MSGSSTSWLLPKGHGARTDSTAGRPGASPARDHGPVCCKRAGQARAAEAASGIKYLRRDRPRPCQDVSLQVGVKAGLGEGNQGQTKPPDGWEGLQGREQDEAGLRRQPVRRDCLRP